MSGIVNLNKARKARVGAEGGAEAAANRVRHGRTKAERAAAETAARKAARLLDGHRREPDGTT